MAYNRFLFNKLRDLTKLPTNRRAQYRRTSPRRSQPQINLLQDKRAYSDRRQVDRRIINVEETISRSFQETAISLRDLELITKAFKNVHLLAKKRISQSKIITNWTIDLEGGAIETQLEIDFDSSNRFILFKQLKGDLQRFSGEIELIPDQSNTRMIVSVLIEPGLPSFEAILSGIFKEKINSLIKHFTVTIANTLGRHRENSSHFGFLIHTIPDYFTTAFSDTTYARMPDPLLKYLLSQLPPFKAAKVTGIQSLSGERATGELIFSPLSPIHFLTMNKETVFRHIIEAGEIAKDLGAQILGLGAYSAFVGRRGVEIASALDMPVTTGTAYTIAAALMALEKAAERAGFILSESTISIIGATGSIGKTCAELLSSKVKKLILVARNQSRLKDLVETLRKKSYSTEIISSNDLHDSLQKSDLVLLSTNTPETLVDVKLLKPGTIICDISQPRNVSLEDAAKRNDILVIDGGVVEPPGRPNFNIYFGLPPGLTYACLGETIILTLEKRFESFSIGGNISAEKVREIQSLGEKHGFRLAELKSFGNIISRDKFMHIASVR